MKILALVVAFVAGVAIAYVLRRGLPWDAEPLYSIDETDEAGA